jgi:hypothetical protein
VWLACERTRLGRLDQALIAERIKTISAKHDMIKHTNAERVAGLFQAARDLNVFGTWRRLAARVIMHENYGSRAKVQSGPPDFAWMD